MPFEKGDKNINRNGRPKGVVSIVKSLKYRLQQIAPAEIGGDGIKTYRQLMIDTIFNKAILEKDTILLRDIIDRVDGKPKQNIDHTTKGKELPAPILGGITQPKEEDNNE